MSRPTGVAVVGAGIVGVRCTRELVSSRTAGDVVVRLSSSRHERCSQLRASFGSDVEVVCNSNPLPSTEGIGAVVVARGAGQHLDAVREAIDRGLHVVSTSDAPEEVRELLALDERARRRGVEVCVGAAMSPGLSCLLVALARRRLDRLDEVHIARHGAAGPGCARQRLRALRGTALEWRDGEWQRRPGFSGRELCWFPDPIGGLDCYRADLAEPILVQRSQPDLDRVTARMAASRRDRALAPFPVLVPPPAEGGLGAVRVEARGERDGRRETVVLGALDRPAVVAAALAAVVAQDLVSTETRPGVHGVGATGRESAMLSELARRGVRAAVFEGSQTARAQVSPADRR